MPRPVTISQRAVSRMTHLCPYRIDGWDNHTFTNNAQDNEKSIITDITLYYDCRLPKP